MAEITGPRTDSQDWQDQDEAKLSVRAIKPRHRNVVVGVVIVTLLVVCLAVWGTEMEYPTTVSTERVVTSSGGTVPVTRTIRDVTGSAIDDVVRWVTREGSWLFDGLSLAVTHALINIERGLKWIPWPVIVVGLSLISYAVGRWPLMIFTPAVLLFIGFMGLWENTIDTIALMVVAVAVSVGVGFRLECWGPVTNWQTAL